MSGDARGLMRILYKDYEREMQCIYEGRNETLDELHDYASGNDLKRVMGLPTTERKLEKGPEE